MSNSVSVSSTPLPIDNPTTMLPRSHGVFFVEACPICGLYFFCNNVIVSSCGCTYHPFYMGLYVETNATHCAKPMCGKLLEYDCITSFGFRQAYFQLKRPKLEVGCNAVTKNTSASLQASTPTSCKVFLFI